MRELHDQDELGVQHLERQNWATTYKPRHLRNSKLVHIPAKRGGLKLNKKHEVNGDPVNEGNIHENDT